MVNYGNTKIYKIWSPLGDDIYIGCTTKQYLSQRMVEHRYAYKKYLETGIKGYHSVLVFEKYGVDNCMIELIEAKECNSKDEQKKLEGKYIRELKCVNMIIPDRSKKEYRDTHKEVQCNYNKQYRIDNDIELKYYKSEKHLCSCGIYYTNSHKLRHERTQRHIKLLNTQIQ